eukprot:TRINITY_DN4719_c0_g1_i1.p2 TRINITY_DN4719_c0_g1~~TRINITY_DN4719_c0_g1_i1.p2  ORF type:complete len:410 (+),score=121.05 TRINITY_DN4719_c0_g1_i1:1917-3146(+)
MTEELVPISTNSARDTGDVNVCMKQVKMRYGAVVLIVFLIALMFKWISEGDNFWRVFNSMDDKCHGNEYCLGSTFTFRLSFSLFVFFFIHAVLSTGFSRDCLGDAAFKAFLTQGMIFKVILLAILIVITLFIPFDFFVGYGYFAFGMSILFLLIQTVILLDFAYSWNDRWIPPDGAYESEEDASRYKKWAICCTFIFFNVGIVICSLCYKWFAPSGCPSEDKNLQLFFITLTLVFGVLGTLGSAAIERGSILISSFAFAYCAIMTYSAIRSRGKEECDELYSDPTKINFNTILSLVIAAVAIIHASLSAGSSRSALTTRDIDDEEYFSFSYFFACFCLGSCYLAMTLNSWDINTGTSPGHDAVLASETSEASMWIKISTVWITMILFTWALLAPVLCGEEGYCCKERTF